MPAPAPFSSPHNQPHFPALYLYPLNDSFVPKHVTLLHNQRVKIGRQTNVKTVPAERNGYFDSKVLSRQHAEVWEEGAKIFIKDVKSSNGTFINGERLSAEGVESEPYELKSDDIVEFGIDIVGEDNKTIIHHKVAARVVCVFSEQDVQAAARAEQHQSSGLVAIPSQAGSSGASNSFNFAGTQSVPSSSQRRPTLQQQGLAGMGGMGGSMRPPGKSGLTFDHILSRLQGELQKSRETGAELHSLTGAMNDIHDTLGGALPPNLPPYPQSLPPVRPPQQQPQNEMSPPDQNPAPPLSALTELQAQLHDTQSSLASHVDKIRALEGVLAEHEAIKREVSSLHEIMEERKREMESARSTSPSLVRRHEKGEFVGEFEGDDDDAGSIRTIVPHELERVEEEDEDQLAAEEEEAEEDRRRRREELGRPRTPEPTGMGITEYVPRHMSKLLSAPRRRSLSPPSRDSPSRPKLSSVVDELTQRLSTLSDQLETALELSSSLQVQHATAQTTISALETKVSALETLVHATQSQVQSQTLVQEASRAQANEAARHPSQNSEQERESLTQMLDDWKTGVEGQWSSVQEEWNQERDRLSKAKDEWENKVRAVEAGLGSAAARVDTGLASLAAVQTQLQHQWHLGNGDAKHNSSGGLVTPPSPRSLSADSTRPRQRRKRSNSSRGRSRSQLGGARPTTESDSSADNSSVASASVLVPGTSPVSRPYSPSPDEVSDREVLMKKAKADSAWFLATPDSPHHPCPTQSADATPSKRDEASLSLADGHPISISTVVGVLVLSVAAAAVIWRVKPE